MNRTEVIQAAEIRRELCAERGLPPSAGCAPAEPVKGEGLHRLAAAAARYELKWAEFTGAWIYDMPRFDWRHWRPREDDGDAHRLAAACRIEIMFGELGGARVEAIPPGDAPSIIEYLTEEDTDPSRAMREAIFRAAVEIGRRATDRS